MTLPATPPSLDAVQGNRAALMLLFLQNSIAALALSLGAGMGLSLIAAFIATALCGMLFFPKTLHSLRHDTRWLKPPSFGLALGAFGLGFLASRAIMTAYIILFPSAAQSIPHLQAQGIDFVFLLLAGGLLIPFAEEVAFRGLMMRGQERAGYLIAAIASSIAFALAHGVPAQALGILPLAYVMARVVQHSGSLWNSVIIHILNNSLALILGYFLLNKVESQPQTQLLQQSALQLPIAIGAGLFGIATIVIAHFWLETPSDETTEKRPWLSGSYLVIILFGILTLASTLPSVRQWFSSFNIS